ncbi:MAG: response regulator transcription factor, partial [Chloroflexi bacterium]|nr:response regulator transcription factor [Chloroflexota bacterium]
HLRATSSARILLLTEGDSLELSVAALELGADDVVARPFALAELLARIKALLRRAGSSDRPLLEHADLRLDRSAREAFRAGRRLPLSSHELDLLAFLLSQPGRAFSRDDLCRHVWGYPYAGESNFIDVAIMELRKKLEADGCPRLIQTVRGFGYSLRER